MSSTRLTRLALATLAYFLVACAHEPPPGTFPLEHADFARSDSPTPPLDGWSPTSLPDHWDLARLRQSHGGWYRLDAVLETVPDELWAVYLPRLVMNATVLVNGHVVGSGGRMTEPPSRNWNRPLLFTIPTGLLHTGSNRIDVHLVHTGSPALLAPPVVGPERLLRPLWSSRLFRQVTLDRVLGVLAVLAAALVGLVFVARGRDTSGGYRWGAAAVVLWAVVAEAHAAREIAVPSWLWEWGEATALNAIAPCFVVALHRRLGLHRPRLERALLAVWLAGALALLVAEPALHFTVLSVWTSLTIAVAAYLLVTSAAAVRARPDLWTRFLAPAALTLAFAVHDFVLVFGGRGLTAGFLMPYMLPALVVLAAWDTLRRLLGALSESETLNRELERRVQDKHAELQASYERLRALERERTITDERERITRDIHDGLGGHLVSTLAMLEGGDDYPRDDVAEAVRGALDDLRLVIDSLDPVGDDLLSVLATVRARLEPRLRRRGICFDWQVSELPPLGLGPERLLRALRIVQEAITNVVKHAGASRITVRTGTQDSQVLVEVADDGGGFDPARAQGRGLVNMRRRAAELGGTVRVESGTSGTRVTLAFPLPVA